MPLPLSLLRRLQTETPKRAWTTLFQHAWEVCSQPLIAAKASQEVTRRNEALGAADLFLATAGWELWRSYEDEVERTANTLVRWWNENGSNRAVLVLDALSLREVPWLLEGARARGYTLHQARATGAELPADTTPFAEALGFSSRSALQNNGGAGKGRLQDAATESTDLPWEDCAAQLNFSKDWLLWHHWPDERLHELAVPGRGLDPLTREAAEKLSSAGFWKLVHVMTSGRRLVITADHGYAASGHFPDTVDAGQARYLKERFGSGRWAKQASLGDLPAGAWVPPIDLQLQTAHADASFALGRRKWKSQGGYPTLAHGGLSLLEVAVPFIELSRPLGA